MDPQIPRRSLLQLGLVAPLLMLAACSDVSEPPPAPVPSPTPTTTKAPGNSTRPAVVTSFGPNGTHYPAELLWIGDTAATDIEIDCTWVAIERAVSSLTAAQVAAGVILRVVPGVLVGKAAGSRVPPVLSGLGDPNWTQSVVIVPRDGYGTVFVKQMGFRIDKCHHLAFVGFNGADVDFYATNCTDVTLVWSEWAGLNFTQSGANLGMYEIVLGFQRSSHDTFAVRPTDLNEMLNLTRSGCVFGPSVKPLGDASHSDSLQLERTGFGAFGPFTSIDCVDFGSSNSVELLHSSLSVADYQHCLILGQQLPWTVYPLKDTDQPGDPNAFAGSAQDVRLRDSVVGGPIGRLGFTHVVNTRISYQPVASQQPTQEGAWIVDTSIASWTAEDIENVAGTSFDRATLSSHWVW